MNESLEKSISKWQSAGVIDAETAGRIRAFETKQGSVERLRWPVLLALGLGGVVICAGILLFVAAHWDQLSPGERFTLVLTLTALFPIGGAFVAPRFPALATTLYAVGTVCTGAGIFMAAQIFNLEEHWPNGILLWVVAALAGWLLLRDWPQATIAAVLAPAWLASEWSVRTDHYWGPDKIAVEGLLLLAVTYFTAELDERESSIRKALVWIGGISILPFTAMLLAASDVDSYRSNAEELPGGLKAIGWIVALGAPLLVAFFLRGRAFWRNGVAAVWILALGELSRHGHADKSIAVFLWLAIGAFGLIGWGLLERRKGRINVGVLAFAITVIAFYFSSVMDKLGRSASTDRVGLAADRGGMGDGTDAAEAGGAGCGECEMNFSSKGLVLAVVQVLLVASLGAKLQMDRSRLPRVWVKTAVIDPDLPIRGRYVAVRLEVQLAHPVPAENATHGTFSSTGLLVRDGQLIAENTPGYTAGGVQLVRNRNNGYAVAQPVLFFLPEHALDPQTAARNGELWAEVTVPEHGLPRPIRLAVKRGDSFTPLETK